MKPRKSAVVEDMDAFMAWLAQTPFVMSAWNKKRESPATKDAQAPSSSGADAEFLAALKAMA